MTQTDLHIRQELGFGWKRGQVHSKIVKEGKVWCIEAELLSDGSGPVYNVLPNCDSMTDAVDGGFYDAKTFSKAEKDFKLVEKFSCMPVEDLALHVNEDNEKAKIVMAARLKGKPCGCPCEAAEACPFKENF